MKRKIVHTKGNEGEIFNKWLESRLIRNNKNVLSAELGPTGSGKSYRDLRKAELWYEYYFKEKFPTENICFGVGAVINRLAQGELRKGEVIIVEEAGVNLGSRNWQQKFSKMFNYILQSFRSMNIALFFNLPYLSMLDSQARHLLHYYAESVGIDMKTGKNKCKPFFLQVAQGTGKIYRHYPLVMINGRSVKVKRFNYSLPAQYLIDAYEEKKAKYLKNLLKGFSESVSGKEKSNRPSDKAFQTHALYQKEGATLKKVGEEMGFTDVQALRYVRRVEEWYKSSKKEENKGDVVPK